MAWMVLALLVLSAAALLWRLGVARGLWSFVGAALMLGAAGYAWQGRPTLAESPVAATARTVQVEPALIDLRTRMFGQFTVANTYLVASDAMTRSGDRRRAIEMLIAGINAAPRDLALWTALGLAYADHDAATLSPPARFAFNRAFTLAPQHPGPWFFLGLAQIRGNQLRAARASWLRAFRLTPADASYRMDIAERLFLLDRFLATPEGQSMAE